MRPIQERTIRWIRETNFGQMEEVDARLFEISQDRHVLVYPDGKYRLVRFLPTHEPPPAQPRFEDG
jgi:hypothetical protein